MPRVVATLLAMSYLTVASAFAAASVWPMLG